MVSPDRLKQSVQCPGLTVHAGAAIPNFNISPLDVFGVVLATKYTSSSWLWLVVFFVGREGWVSSQLELWMNLIPG